MPQLHDLFEQYFIKTREWYNIRHTVLDLTFYQVITKFRPFNEIFRQFEDIGCIQTIKFYDIGFDSIFNKNHNKFINLKYISILNFEGRPIILDVEGEYIQKIFKQKYLKPENIEINKFIDNFEFNQKI